jgi:hypothetical protein
MIEIDKELRRQIRALSAEVHDLLNGPDGDGQLTGRMERQRVTLEVPRAFVMLATFMATFEARKNEPNAAWTHICDEGKDIDHRMARLWMRRYLEGVIEGAMHQDLHWVATHWFLEMVQDDARDIIGKIEDRSEPGDLDDEIPF